MFNKKVKCDYKKIDILKYFKKNKAIFIDRDGTIHVDKVMTHKIEDLEFFKDTYDTIKYFNKLKYKIIIVTNQSGIAKGIYNEKTMHKFNMFMLKQLKKHKCKIDGIYYCPHLTDGECCCSKPKTGMIDQAIKDFNLDKTKCYMIGDKMSDILTGINSNITPILVTTGIYEKGDYHNEEGYNKTIITVNSLDETKKYIK